MRILILGLAALMVACGGGEPERHTATVDVDMTSAAGMLMAIDAVTDNEIDVDALLELTRTVGIDEEKQADLTVSFGGENVEVFYHVWREHPDWVHIYASSTSQDLVNQVQAGIAPFAREVTEE